jgi:uncharacterized membrane protein YfcA
MTHAAIGEELVQLTSVFLEDERLRRWFMTLRGLSASERDSRLLALVETMKARAEKPSIISAVAAPRRAEIFSAVDRTLRHHRRSDLLSFASAVALFIITVALAALGVWLLKRSGDDDQVTGTRYFWPGVICLLTTFGLLIFVTGRGFFRMIRTSRDTWKRVDPRA